MKEKQDPLDIMAEALRKSHCARLPGEGHECIGECTLTSTGVKLACRLCGSGGTNYGPPQRFFDAAERIAESVLDWGYLSYKARTRLAEAVERELKRID